MYLSWQGRIVTAARVRQRGRADGADRDASAHRKLKSYERRRFPRLSCFRRELLSASEVRNSCAGLPPGS